jgi:hypothetical protein
MKKVVLLVILALCVVMVSSSAWSAGLATGDVVYQGPGEPQPPK